MVILHCMKKEKWNEVKRNPEFGEKNLQIEGFIHCSSVEYFWRVAPNFTNIKDDLVLLCIDTDKLKAEIRWEDGDNCGREYPHIYGLINTNSVIKVLPYNKDIRGNWIKNEEFDTVQNK
ncbi:DUF952 domain-containing protein [Vallitalea okinawensis]|uniref:DUF952 domain-containing protein n=1 Tax=Vallitalea okinawensis TaxID=2078660 RepID=UPI000CFDD396|nr:DUF952 domain-containing protein [Vallitalea okinawensis]